MGGFRDLNVWQKAHYLVIKIYELCQKLPASEKYGLISQIQRTAVSVTANIAEGFGRYHQKDKMNFYRISRGSLYEMENLLEIIKDIGYLEQSEIEKYLLCCEEVEKMINGLIRSQKNRG